MIAFKLYIIPCFENPSYIDLFGVSVLLIRLDLLSFKMPQTNLVGSP